MKIIVGKGFKNIVKTLFSLSNFKTNGDPGNSCTGTMKVFFFRLIRNATKTNGDLGVISSATFSRAYYYFVPSSYWFSYTHSVLGSVITFV